MMVELNKPRAPPPPSYGGATAALLTPEPQSSPPPPQEFINPGQQKWSPLLTPDKELNVARAPLWLQEDNFL